MFERSWSENGKVLSKCGSQYQVTIVVTAVKVPMIIVKLRTIDANASVGALKEFVRHCECENDYDRVFKQKLLYF